MSFFNVERAYSKHKAIVSDFEKKAWVRHKYRRFKKNWKRATNDLRCKPTLIVQDRFEFSNNGRTRTLIKGGSSYWQPGWLTSEHFLLYNIVMGKPLHNGFSPISSKRKQPSVAFPWQNFWFTLARLESIVKEARHFYENGIKSKRDFCRVEKVMVFLEPFGNSITIENLVYDVDIDQFETIRQFYLLKK